MAFRFGVFPTGLGTWQVWDANTASWLKPLYRTWNDAMAVAGRLNQEAKANRSINVGSISRADALQVLREFIEEKADHALGCIRGTAEIFKINDPKAAQMLQDIIDQALAIKRYREQLDHLDSQR